MKFTHKLKMHGIAIAFAVAITGTQSASAITWTQWATADGGNDHWYGLTDSATSWTDARNEALAAHPGSSTDLVAINSAEEQGFLVSTFGTAQLLWIGLTDENDEGNWSTWVNGEPVTYSNWYPGEPNDYQPLGGEDYGAINARSEPEGWWNDRPASPGFRGIIERVDSSTNVPDGGGTLAMLSLGAAGLSLLRRRTTEH